jgi:hypothetical protein
VPKGPKGQKRKLPKGSERPSASAISRWENEGGATEKLPRKLPEDPVSRAVAITREATGDKNTKPGGR